jgi:hypothetical protein
LQPRKTLKTTYLDATHSISVATLLFAVIAIDSRLGTAKEMVNECPKSVIQVKATHHLVVLVTVSVLVTVIGGFVTVIVFVAVTVTGFVIVEVTVCVSVLVETEVTVLVCVSVFVIVL